MKKRKIWVFTWAEAIAMAIPLSAVASLHIDQTPLYVLLNLIGRAGGCSYPRTLTIDQDFNRMNESVKRLYSSSRIDLEDKGKGQVRWQTPHGQFWAPPDTNIQFLLSEQLGRFYGDGERRVRNGDVVIDCGANIGTFVWEALSAGARLVVAVEPSERNIESLHRNFTREIEAGRVIIYPKGVWNKEDTLTFHVFDNSALDSIVMEHRWEEGKQPRTVSIPVTTVDKIVAELKLDRVDYIKMDIEGAERDAIEGSRETIKRFRPRLSIATENLPDDPVVLPALIKRLRPDYQAECGPCQRQSMWAIQAEVFYFF